MGTGIKDFLPQNRERLSSSKLELAMKCLHWLRPSAGPAIIGKPKTANAGTVEHKNIEHTMRTGVVDVMSPTHERWIDDWYIPYGSDGFWIIEQGMAMDADGHVIVGPGASTFEDGMERYAWAPPDHVPGTSDALRVFVDRKVVVPKLTAGCDPLEALRDAVDALRPTANEILVHVVDWKSGFRARTHLSRAKRNVQILHLGAMAVEYFGADAALVEILFVRPDGTWRDPHRIEAMELAPLRVQVGRIIRALEDLTDEEVLRPRRGPWCGDKYCPQHGQCPATKGALEYVDPSRGKITIPRSGYDVMSPQHATDVYHLLRAMQARVTEAWNALRTWQDETGPIMVRPGIAWGRKEYRAERIDMNKPGALEVMREVLGDFWWDAVNFSTAKVSSKPGARSIRSGARRKADELSQASGKRVTIISVEERVLTELRLLEAARTTVSTKVDEFPVSDSDLQNYPWLEADPDGAKIVERLEEDEPDDDNEEKKPWE